MKIEQLLKQIQELEFKNAELRKHVAGQQRAKERFAKALADAEIKLAEERRKRQALERRLIDLGLFSPTGQLRAPVKPAPNVTRKAPFIPCKTEPAKWGAAGELAPDHGFCEFAATKGQ